MNAKRFYDDNVATIERIKSLPPAKSWEEANGRANAELNAVRCLYIGEAYRKTTDAERAFLRTFPTWEKLNGNPSAKELKARLGVSWSELDLIRRFCWDETGTF